MRKCLGVFLLCTFLLTFGTTAEAANVSGTWVSGTNGNWSTTTNWSAYPEGTGTATINNGTVLLDTSQSVGITVMGNGVSTDVGVLNITNGSNLNLYKSGSSELFSVLKGITGSSQTVNHGAGTVRVGLAGTTNGGTQETRLVTGSTVTIGTAAYNLYGTAVLDTDVLSKGNKVVSGATFNATGGTLVARTMIYKFGKVSEGYGFNQGQAKLEVGAIDTVAALGVGNLTNATDYKVNGGGTMNFDIASATSFDKITQFGDIANTAGATLSIDLLGYTPAPMSFFDVWTFSAYTGQTTTSTGSGAFATVPAGWTAAWVDTTPVPDGITDTLRLTYVPEPATIALLGLGLLAIRRNKK